jgi:tRNA(Ile)-lysidine synthase
MLEAKVEAFLERHSFTLENKKMVVGVSGGPDSLALLYYLSGQRDKRGISIVAAHVDHMFRGQESLEDALFVKAYCKLNHIPFEMAQINVPKRIEQSGRSTQAEAREARYEFFAEVLEKYDYPYLVLGHHGDDQMETILMRLTRGSSGKARAGIPFIRPFGNAQIFRPFLGLSRGDIEQYCNEHHLQPRIDPSNAKSVYSRNRFRKEVLPFLKSENRQVHEHFQRFSEDLQIDESFLQELTVKSMNTVMKTEEAGNITIDIKRFIEMPLPLQRRGIQLILNYLYNERPSSLSAVHIDQIFSLIQHSQPSGKLDLPSGLKVIRSYQTVSFQTKTSEAENYSFVLEEPGLVDLPNGSEIKIEYVSEKPDLNNQNYACFEVDNVVWPIKIRTRAKGDRMTLKGMTGSKKLKDIFIDSKIPLQEREIWPVVEDGNAQIIWLPGLKKASNEGVKSNNNKYILLTFRK